jgi:GNAT superfamily N-acetyltransferase
MRIVLPADRPRYIMPLEGGSVATLSPVLKADREFFEKGLEELSLQSRFARFGQGISSLSERELDYLTDVDQRHHVAWGALLGDQAAGVGRYIVLPKGQCAEFAITVLDEVQGRGVGRALFDALVAVARADGIEELCFEAQADNEAVMYLLSELEVAPLISDGMVERRIRLSEVPPTLHDEALAAVIDEVRQAGESPSSSSEAEFTQ